METKIDKGKFRVRIIQDEFPENPRTSWDNISTLLCAHRKYTLGDKDAPKHLIAQCGSWDEVGRALYEEEKAVAVLPVYMYDHSYITVSTRPFNCPWDSGQLGLIYITREKLRKMGHGWRNITKKRKETLIEWLENDIQIYDQYLRGDVYGYVVEKKIVYSAEGHPDIDEWEIIDSCFGYYGEDFKANGMQENYQCYIDAGCEVTKE